MRALQRRLRALGLFRALVLIGVVLSLAATAGTFAGSPPAPSSSPSPVVVRFVEPAPPGLVLGSTRVTVEASTTPDARITRVEIYADGALLSVFEHPPWSLRWNAGGGPATRTLRAIAVDSLGRQGEATLITRPVYIGQYEEVRLISLYATVRDRQGAPVVDLGKDDFVLLEDGTPQTITHFTSAKVPLTVAVLIDASNSMNLGGKIDLARKAALEFVDSVDLEDPVLVMSFNDELYGLTQPSAERRLVKAAIESVEAKGGTALYDALYRAADRLAGAEGRRAIVLLSDGRDQAFTDNEPGSLHLFEEALERAKRTEVAVYTIGLGRHMDEEMDLRHERSLKDILDTLARTTGGRSYYPERPGQLSGIYRQIAVDLKSQYALAYISSNIARDGTWRAVSLATRNPSLTVTTRTGYYAPKGSR